MRIWIRSVVVALSLGTAAYAGPFDSFNSRTAKALKKDAEGATAKRLNASVAKKVNARLLTESRKNQCSFKVDSDQLAPGL
jgi:hypothetical protein